MNEEKNALRTQCKKIRNSLNTKSLSLMICNTLKGWDVFINAKNIMLFYPIGSEISLLELLNISGKNFYFPCVNGESIFAALYTSSDNFRTGKFGIAEPVGERLTDCSFLDLVFVPALAVDKIGNRLGYGKGYYDRFLALYPDLISAVPCPSKLCFNTIPADIHDIPVEYLITENSIIKTIRL